MRVSSSVLRAFVVLGSVVVVLPLVFVACGPGPAIVTSADQAILIRPAASASASAAPIASSTVPAPLQVPDRAPRELPPFSCRPPGHQIAVLGRVFCIVAEPRDWHAAEAFCQDQGGHLAMVKSAALATVLQKLVVSPTGVDRFWIGLAEPNEGRWIWSNGTAMKFSAWHDGEPNNSGRGEDCGEWLTSGGRWNDVDCFQPRHFLCEGTAPPVGSRATGITCTGKRFTVGKRDYCLLGPATWEVAQKTCVQNGSELAMIDSADENAALFGALGSKIPDTNLWIGLSDEAAEGQFHWITGEPVDTLSWRPGEPNNIGNEDCVEWVSADGLWNDLACSTARSSLCEMP